MLRDRVADEQAAQTQQGDERDQQLYEESAPHPALLTALLPVTSMLNSLRHLKAISGAPYCFQVTRILGICLYLLANPANIHVDRARRHEPCIAPDRVKQMAARE